MKRDFLLFILLLVTQLSVSLCQEIELEHISVLRFEGWTGSDSRTTREYQNALTDKLLTRIIQTHRFKVIDRSNLERILKEQSLHLTGLVDEASVVKTGKVLGINKFILGSFTRNSTEYHSAEYSQGTKIRDAFYTAQVEVSVRLLDVETALYLEATEAAAEGTSPDKRNALLNALDELADMIITQFEKYFAIQAYIVAVDKGVVILDRGAVYGVREGMDFLVYDIPRTTGQPMPIVQADDEYLGIVRIVRAESQSAQGRIMTGFDKVKPGHLIRETKSKIGAVAMVIDRTGANVLINAGKTLGIARGMTFDVVKAGREIEDPITGEVIRTSPITVGVIYITEPGTRSSKGKILRGQRKVDTGMWILERETETVSKDVSFSFGLLSTTIQPNPISGTFTVENEYTGSHEVTIDYSEYDELAGGMLLQMSGERRDLVNSYSIGAGLGWFTYSSDLGAWTFDLRARYNLDLIPEKLLVSPSLSVGYGQVKQKLSGNIISQISDGQSKALTSRGFSITPQVGMQINLGHITLAGDVVYRVWNATEWTYQVKTGKKTESGTDETENVEFDVNLVPYPEVSVGGFYFLISLSINDLYGKIFRL